MSWFLAPDDWCLFLAPETALETGIRKWSVCRQLCNSYFSKYKWHRLFPVHPVLCLLWGQVFHKFAVLPKSLMYRCRCGIQQNGASIEQLPDSTVDLPETGGSATESDADTSDSAADRGESRETAATANSTAENPETRGSTTDSAFGGAASCLYCGHVVHRLLRQTSRFRPRRNCIPQVWLVWAHVSWHRIIPKWQSHGWQCCISTAYAAECWLLKKTDCWALLRWRS